MTAAPQKKPPARYPPVGVSVLNGAVSTVRSGLFCSLFCTYAVMNDTFGLPPLVRWVEAGANVPLPSAVADRIVALVPGAKARPAPPGSLFGAGDTTGVQLRLVPVRDVVEMSPAGKWLDEALFADGTIHTLSTAPSGDTNTTGPVTAASISAGTGRRRLAVDSGGYRKTFIEALTFSLVSTVLHAVPYFVINTLFMAIGASGLLRKYELPRTPRMLPSAALLKATLMEAVMYTLVQVPVFFLMFTFALRIGPMLGAAPDATETGAAIPSLSAGAASLPPLAQQVGLMSAASLAYSLILYWAHRIVHEYPVLYRCIHKQHHRYVGTVAFAAEYASPVEQVLTTYLPLGGFLLMGVKGAHPALWIAFMMVRVEETCETHSGFCLSSTPLGRLGLMFGQSVEFHDWHHTDNRGAYGAYWLDCLFRSCDSYMLHKERGRQKAATSESSERQRAKAE